MGIMGSLFHMLNHALAKTLLFFGAGNVLQRFHTKEIAGVKGLGSIMPLAATLLMGGALAITGCPPFSIFLSEFMILVDGIDGGHFFSVVIYLILLAIIFAALLYHVGKMVFGEPSHEKKPEELGHLRIVLMSVLLLLIIVLGIYMPSELSGVLEQVTALFTGGKQ